MKYHKNVITFQLFPSTQAFVFPELQQECDITDEVSQGIY